MTIFNGITAGVQTYLLPFICFIDQVRLSGVSKTAYKTLDNEDYFGKVFQEHYPNHNSLFFNSKWKISELIKGRKAIIDIDIADTSFFRKHPSNCWKVCCCVFQTGQLNFSKSFINEVVIHKYDELKIEKKNLTHSLRRIEKLIYGNSGASNLLQEKSLAEQSLCEHKLDTTSCNDKDAGEASDRLLSRDVDKMKQDQLPEKKSQAIIARLKEIGFELKHAKFIKRKITEPDSTFIYEVEKQALSAYFGSVLGNHYFKIFDKRTKMNEEDRRSLYPAFKVYEEYLRSEGKEPNLITLNGKLTTLNQVSSQEEGSQQGQPNINEAKKILEIEMIRERIESYAKLPLSLEMVAGYFKKAVEIKSLWLTGDISYTSIQEQLLRAIIQEHKDELLSKKDYEKPLDKMSSKQLIQILEPYSINGTAKHFANCSLEIISGKSFNAYVNHMKKIFPNTRPTRLKTALLKALDTRHGPEGVKKVLGEQRYNFFAMIIAFASEPLDAIRPETFNDKIQEVQKLFPGYHNINRILLKAIREKHGMEGVIKVQGTSYQSSKKTI